MSLPMRVLLLLVFLLALAPRAPHFPAKAKRVIFLFMSGGVSHVESFDPKPRLFADHGKTLAINEWQGKPGKYERFLKKPHWAFKSGGKCGTEVSDSSFQFSFASLA